MVDLTPLMEEAGRDPSEFDVATSTTISIAGTHEEAVERLRGSRVAGRGRLSLEDFIITHLVGSPAEVIEKINSFKEEGLSHCTFQRFAAAGSAEEILEQIQMIAEEVIPAFR